MTRKISLVTIRDIKDFVNTARDYGDDIIVRTELYAVPACSLMGVMSLNLNEPIKISFADEFEDRIDKDFAEWFVKD